MGSEISFSSLLRYDFLKYPLWNKKTIYSQDGRNLPEREEEGDLVTRIGYRGDSNLPMIKIVCDRETPKIQTTYEYNNDTERILIREIVDDGVSRIIKQFTPCQHDPYYGLPQIIEEKYHDGTQEILLKKIVLHYREGALIAQKDIYNANNIYCYSLKYDYDNKGRVIYETNPIGQEAISKYDEIGNRYYFKDFSGRVELNCRYDYSNRLIEKEEVGFDGIKRVFRYSYDKKHNLESETDSRGNETSYSYDPLGRKERTTFPKIIGEQEAPVITQKYDSAGNEILHTDPENNVTETQYNAYGKPTLIIHPDGSTEENIYNLDGTLKTHIDPEGVATTYEYDYLKRIKKKTISSAEESFTYSGSYLISKIDPENN